MKQGLVEKRQHHRIQVSIKASYEMLSEDKAKAYTNNPGYTAQHNPIAEGGGMFSFLRGEAKDISEGGMALVGTEEFHKGQKMVVRFEIPSLQTELTYVAEVRWVEQFEEMKRPMYRAGLKFLFLKTGDAMKMHTYIMSKIAKTSTN
jgi:c-di-GMP-binding flagellar brake protein YcgR